MRTKKPLRPFSFFRFFVFPFSSFTKVLSQPSEDDESSQKNQLSSFTRDVLIRLHERRVSRLIVDETINNVKEFNLSSIASTLSGGQAIAVRISIKFNYVCTYVILLTPVSYVRALVNIFLRTRPRLVIVLSHWYSRIFR